MAELILEFYCEEIPAGMQARAMENLAQNLADALAAHNIKMDNVQTYVAPQRLALLADGLPQKTTARKIEKKGPKVNAPQKAIDGFLAANGLKNTDGLKVQTHPKGDFYILEREEKAHPVTDVLAEILPALTQNFPWPKAMRWGGGNLRWVRPLRAILCRFDGAIIPFSVDGLQAGGVTYGHRFMAARAIEIKKAGDYLPKLKQAKVLADPVARRAEIETQITKLAKAAKLDIVPDDALLNEIAGLVEWPVCLMGKIDETFIKDDVPDEVLITIMRHHQKYLSLRDPKTKKLAPCFIVVANMVTKDKAAAIIAGNERVLRARLADGQFFWAQDKKTPLADHLPALKNLIFHEKRTMYQHCERVAELVEKIAEQMGADVAATKEAARLCKADLTSAMVYEFPKLQGIMGGYYAADKKIGAAICDHYKPQGASDDCPATPEACAVALADKIETLCYFWSIDQKPTGSKDPYALRRAALGVIRIFMEQGIAEDFINCLPDNSSSIRTDLSLFIIDRLKAYLRDKENIAHDVVDAVSSFHQTITLNIVDLVHHARSVHNFLATPDGQHLLVVYRRAHGIIKKSGEEGMGANFQKERLQENAEKVLYEAIVEAEENSPIKYKEDSEAKAVQIPFGDAPNPSIKDVRQFEAKAQGAEPIWEHLKNLSALRAPVDDFFNNVLVDVEDSALKQNRLMLLKGLLFIMNQYADFSKIEGGERG